MRWLVHEGVETWPLPCLPQNQQLYTPPDSLIRESEGGALEQAYLLQEESVTGKCATCKMCVGEVWDSAVSMYLSIHHVQAELSLKSEEK